MENVREDLTTVLGGHVNPEAVKGLVASLAPVDNSGTAVTLADREFVAIYFGGPTSPACRNFTPQLEETYQKLLAVSTAGICVDASIMRLLFHQCTLSFPRH